MPLDRSSLRRALGAYVTGHDRGWTADRKRQTADTSRPETDRQEEATPTFDEPATTSGNRVEIPVPEQLDFHRGPDTWRSRKREAADEGGRA